MPVSAISRYRGGSVESVTPLARRMKAVLAKYGVAYGIGRLDTGSNAGGWIVVVRYADWSAYAKARENFARDLEHKEIVGKLSKLVTLIDRELAIDLEL